MGFGTEVAALQIVVPEVVQILPPEVLAAGLQALARDSKLLAADKLYLWRHGTQPGAPKEFVICLHIGLLLKPVEDILWVVCIATIDLQAEPRVRLTSNCHELQCNGRSDM